MRLRTALLFLCFLPLLLPAQDLLSKADSLFDQRETPDRLSEAVKLLEQEQQTRPGQYPVLWRLCKYLYHQGLHLSSGPVAETFNKAVNYGERAVKVNPKGVEGHYWLAVAYGKYGEAKGVMKSLSLVSPIKREIYTALRTQREYEGAGAYRVLGRLFFKLPGLFGGDKDKALNYLQKGKELYPSNPLTRLYLAEVLFEKKKSAEAWAELDYLLSLTATEARWNPELPLVLKEARELASKHPRKGR